MSEITLTLENFKEEVLQSDKPVLVDFWAPWCGPCNMVAPVIAEIVEEYAGVVKVGKINVEEQQNLAERYHVVNIPTMIVFEDGLPVSGVVGAVPKEKIVALFEK